MVTSTKYAIGNSRIWIFDNLISADHVKQLSQLLKAAAYRRTEVATPASAHITHHSVEFSAEQIHQIGLVKPTMFAMQQMVPATTFNIHRQYCNACYFGDLLLPHRDAMPGQGDITALWYLNSEWDMAWGGATQFFDESNATAISVLPKPGRLALFDGELLHVGMPPNRQCFEPRFTLAIKLFPKPA